MKDIGERRSTLLGTRKDSFYISQDSVVLNARMRKVVQRQGGGPLTFFE